MLFQCPARWTTLTCVVSPGQNPLQAEVYIKHNREHLKELFSLDQADWQYGNFISPHYYSDPILTLSDPCIEMVISVVRDEIEKFIEYVEEEIDAKKEKPGTIETVHEMTYMLGNFHSTCAVLNTGHYSCLQGQQNLELPWIYISLQLLCT